jgi:selenocysteine-specific elongation factor
LTGLSTTDLTRGSVLTPPGWLEPSQLIDVRLRLLPDSPRPLRHNQEVEVFTGAAEVIGYTRLLGIRQLEPGQTGWVQLRLARRIPVIKGDRFIIRQPSPSTTIGGGVVVDPLPRRRHRRFRPDLLKRLDTLLAGTPEDVLMAELDQRGPVPVQTLLAECRLPTEIASAALANLLKKEDAFLLVKPVGQPGNLSHAKALVASRAGWASLLGQITAALLDYHSRFPLRSGMPRGELKSRLKLETRLFNEAIQRGQQEEALVATENTVRTATHQVKFAPAQQAAVDKLLADFRRAPYNTPLPKDVATAVGDEVMLALIEGGQLIRLSPEVILLNETYNGFIGWLRDYLKEHQTVNVAQVRDTFSTSRKYALALLEYTDEQHITKRVGDERVLRQ